MKITKLQTVSIKPHTLLVIRVSKNAPASAERVKQFAQMFKNLLPSSCRVIVALDDFKIESISGEDLQTIVESKNDISPTGEFLSRMAGL